MRILIVFLCLIAYDPISAQLLFGTKRVIEECETNGPLVVLAADLDGDGDLDVVSGSKWDNRVGWYANDGAGNFGPQQLLATNVVALSWVHADDLDADGDIDLIVGTQNDHLLCWFENDGAGGFSDQIDIATFSVGVRSITTGDLDGDADPDIVVCHYSGTISWFANNGSAEFGVAQSIPLFSFGNAEHATCKDMDGDGDVDIIYSTTSPASFVLNNGDGTFIGPFELPGVVPIFRQLVLEDVNSDGILDAVGSSYLLGKHSVWCEGVGDGTFLPAEQLFGPTGNWTLAEDMDGDGDRDLVSASTTNGTVNWFENDGNGQFDVGHEITHSAYWVMHIYAADLDADGDLDILSASNSDDKIAWYRNNGVGQFGPQQMITEAASTALMAFGIDMDTDGDNDVVAISFSDHKLAWYPNNGGGQFGEIQRITTTAAHPETMCYGDMDGDGDLDILLGTISDSTVALYKNNGAGVFDEVVIIDDILYFPSALSVADLDGDGDLDVMSTGQDSYVYVYFNSGNNVYTRQSIATITGSGDVISRDLDNDGDMDLIYDNGSGVRWKANDGGGIFGTAQTIYPSYAEDQLESADMDGDGDQDIIFGHGNSLVICVNDALTFSPLVIDNSVSSPVWSRAVDIDNDGDMDLLVALPYIDRIWYYKNLGGLVFDEPEVVCDSLNFPQFVSSADLNGDGKPDVISVATSDNEVVWIPNIMHSAPLATENVSDPSVAVITVVPNPMSSAARLIVDRTLTSNDQIDLVDAQGRVIRSMNGNGTDVIVFERNGLAAGYYVAWVMVKGRKIASVNVVVE